jgi:cytochrome b subunit of formate dehydrogenase
LVAATLGLVLAAAAVAVIPAVAAAVSAAPVAEAPPDTAGPRRVVLVAPGGDYRVTPEVRSFGARETERCLYCHSVPNFMVRDSFSLAARRLSVDPVIYRASVHGAISCTQCHGNVRELPHGFRGGRPRVGCDADCHVQDARGRPVRHDAEAADFSRDVHREGLSGRNPDLPDCVYCHGAGDPHAVPAARGALAPSTRMALCATCHDDRERMTRNQVEPDAVSSYRASFHYKAVRLGSARAAVCEDCHTAHRVIAPRDTASTVNRAHLPRTCGQEGCHRGAQLNFAMSGANHLALRIRRDPVLALVETLLFWCGLVTVLVLGAGVLLDLQRKLGRPSPPVAPPPADPPLIQRLSRAQRWQHWALMASFTALALSGLSLRFADVRAFQALNVAIGGLALSHAIHRAGAVILMLLGIVHLGYVMALLARRRFDLRAAWTMLPRAKDLRDWRDLSLYYLRRRAAPPEYGRHHFREKLHYFAALLGLPLMTGSGLLLWFPVFFGNRLPDSAFGIAYLAHSDEAIVAVLVVVIWHLYNVHVVPGAHHRFMTWIDGRITLGQWQVQHGLEAARTVAVPLAPADRSAEPLARAAPWILAAILVAGLLLRVREAVRTPFWFDELFTLWMARHPLPEALALLPGDIHPPLPTLLVSLWLAVGGDDPLWLKTLPLLLGMLAVLATYGLAKSMFGRGPALLAAALMALHPTHIYFSQELRGYGLLTLLLLMAAWSAWRWTETGRIRFALAWVASAALAFYTHYLGAVVLGLLSLYALAVLRGSRPRLVTWLLVHAGIALLVAPLLLLIPGQLRLSHDSWLVTPLPADLVELARRISFGAYYLVPVLGLVALLPLALRARRRAAAFAWWMGIGTVVLTFLLSRRGVHLFSERYMYFTLPYWCALFGAGLCALPWRRAVPVALAAVLLFEARAAMLRQPLPEAVDLRRVSRLLAERMKPGDLLYCAETHSLLCLDYHLGRPSGQLLMTEPSLPYYRGSAMFPPSRLVPLDSLRAAAQAGRRWWGVFVPESGRPGLGAWAAMDSLTAGERRSIGVATVWASDPRMLRGGRY